MTKDKIDAFSLGFLECCYRRGVPEKQAAVLLTKAIQDAVLRGAPVPVTNPVVKLAAAYQLNQKTPCLPS